MSELRVLMLGDARSIHLQRLADEYTRQGVALCWLSLERGDERAVRLPHRGMIRPLYYILSAVDVRNRIQQFQPHVVNAHFASGYGFVAVTATRHLDLPVVLHIWGSDILIAPSRSGFSKRKVQGALRNASLVIGDSRYLVEAASRISDIARTEVIPWGIERQYFELFDASRKVATPVRVIMPRPHEPVYNTEFALDALEPLLGAGAITLTVPAWGKYRRHFEDASSHLPPGSIVFYERCSRHDFMTRLGEHDVYLSCSRSDSSPASLIEAMALGLVPVVGDIPGVRELMAGDTGLSFPLSSPPALYDTMKRLIDDPAVWAEQRRRNHERMKSEATFEVNVERTIALLQKVAGRG